MRNKQHVYFMNLLDVHRTLVKYVDNIFKLDKYTVVVCVFINLNINLLQQKFAVKEPQNLVLNSLSCPH